MPKSPKPPAPINAANVAQTQQQYNTQAGQASQAGSAVNQVTPYGSLGYEFSVGPNGVQRLTANQTLSPEQQALLNTLQGTQQQAGEYGSNLLRGTDYSTAPDLSTATDSIVNQNLDRYTKYLDPLFTQQTENLDNQLRNQGIVPGTEAYDRAINNLRQSQNQTVTGFTAQMQPTAYNQAVSTYKLPAEMAQGFAQFGAPSSVKGNLVDTPTANYGQVDFSGLAGQQQSQAYQNYQAKLNQYNGLMQGIFSPVLGALGGPIGGAIGTGIGNIFGGDRGLNSWMPTVQYG